MTLRPMGAALAALATAAALVVWVASTPGSAKPATGRAPTTGPHASAADEAPTLPAEATATARPLQSPQPLQVPAATAVASDEAGFTLAVTARHVLPNRNVGPPSVARLEVGAQGFPSERGVVLRTIDTDANGQAELFIPRRLLAEAMEGERPRLFVRSAGEGVLPRVAYVNIPREDGAFVRLTVDLVPGAVVEGRLVGPDGQPVAGVVDAWRQGPRGLEQDRLASAGPDGRFVAELRWPGRHRFVAGGTSHPEDITGMHCSPNLLDLGTGASEEFDVVFGRPVPFIEIRVSGPGVIQGHVRDASGAPAAGVELLAVLAELDDHEGAGMVPPTRGGELEQRGGGHLTLQTSTDAEGAFVFRGLRQGLFHVRGTVDRALNRTFEMLLTQSAVPSDGVPLVLRLDRPHLAIHVRGPDGSPSGRVLGSDDVGNWEDAHKPWPEVPRLVVAFSPRHVHLDRWFGEGLEVRTVGLGEFVVDLMDASAEAASRGVEPLEVDVALRGGDLAWHPQRVVVPPGAGRLDVDLVLSDPATPGHLVLDVVDATGAQVRDGLRVRVVDSRLGVVVVDAPFRFSSAEGWPVRLPVPAGRYRLEVQGVAIVDEYHGRLVSRREHGAWEQALVVSPGADVRVTATLDRGARLALRLVGSATEADRAAFHRTYGELFDVPADELAAVVDLRLEREGRYPEHPYFVRRALERDAMGGDFLFPSLRLGQEDTSELLAPGSYTLVGTTLGGREARLPVTLLPGQTTSVTLRFD